MLIKQGPRLVFKRGFSVLYSSCDSAKIFLNAISMNRRSISTAFPWFSSLTGDYKTYFSVLYSSVISQRLCEISTSVNSRSTLSEISSNAVLTSDYKAYFRFCIHPVIVRKSWATTGKPWATAGNRRSCPVSPYSLRGRVSIGSFVQRELSRESVTEGLSFIISNLCFCHFD